MISEQVLRQLRAKAGVAAEEWRQNHNGKRRKGDTNYRNGIEQEETKTTQRTRREESGETPVTQICTNGSTGESGRNGIRADLEPPAGQLETPTITSSWSGMAQFTPRPSLRCPRLHRHTTADY